MPTFRGCQRVRIMHASVCTTTEPSELVTGRQRVRIMRVGVRTLGEVGELFVVCAGALCEADRVPKMPNFARVRLALGVRS